MPAQAACVIMQNCFSVSQSRLILNQSDEYVNNVNLFLLY